MARYVIRQDALDVLEQPEPEKRGLAGCRLNPERREPFLQSKAGLVTQKTGGMETIGSGRGQSLQRCVQHIVRPRLDHFHRLSEETRGGTIGPSIVEQYEGRFRGNHVGHI